jgi:hypothetical protein
MATQTNCGYPAWLDGQTWTGLFARQYDVGPSVIDSGVSASALTPAGGVYPSQGANLAVTAGTGMTVNVAAGYCVVPSTTAQYGAYRFGLMSSGVLTVASNATGSTRQDYVLATVTDLESSSSTAVIQYVTGTTSPPSVPSSSIILAQLAVPNGASSIISGDITDKRGWQCAPGGILYLPTAATAIAAPVSQFFWENDTSTLMQGTGTAGTVTAYQPSSGQVSYAEGESGFPELEIFAGGMTDFEIYYSREPVSGGTAGQSYLELYIDSDRVDTTYAMGTATLLGRFSATYYTSSRQGTTPGAGYHVVSLSGNAGSAAHTLRITPVAA